MTEPAEQLDTRTPLRRPHWDPRVVVVVLGLVALTPMTWQEKTVTNVRPTSWTGLQLDLVPTGLLLYLSLALAVAVLPQRRPWSVVLSAAGVVTMAALLLTQPGDTSASFQGFTQVTHYQWSAPPVVSLVLWLALLAISVGRPPYNPVLLGCGVALPVLMTAGWQRFTINEQAPTDSTGFGLLDGASTLWAAMLIAPMILMVLVILLPARNFAATFVAAAGLVLSVLNVWLGLPDLGIPGTVTFAWLPAAYLSIAVWLIALAATIHARLGFRA